MAKTSKTLTCFIDEKIHISLNLKFLTFFQIEHLTTSYVRVPERNKSESATCHARPDPSWTFSPQTFHYVRPGISQEKTVDLHLGNI